MAEKTEYRLDEYREYENEQWGPWKKLGTGTQVKNPETIQDLNIPENNVDLLIEKSDLEAMGNDILKAINGTRRQEQAAHDPIDAIESFEIEDGITNDQAPQRWIENLIYGWPEVSVEEQNQLVQKYTRWPFNTELEKETREKIRKMIKKYRDKERRLKILLEATTMKVAPAQGQEGINSINDMENHYFMQILKNDYPEAHTAVKNGIKAGIIDFKDNRFNFKCDRGCVGLVFSETGYTDYKQINRFILINEERPAPSTLINSTKNTPPSEWGRIKKVFFPTPLK